MALRFDHQADHAAAVNVKRALLNQQAVHGGVKPAVVNDVVDMAVHVVVRPARANVAKGFVGGSGFGLGTFGGHDKRLIYFDVKGGERPIGSIPWGAHPSSSGKRLGDGILSR